MKNTKIDNTTLQLLTRNLGKIVPNILVENKIFFSFHAHQICGFPGKKSSHPNRPPLPKY